MRTTAVRKGINMLLMDQNIYYEWCLCGLLYAKTKPDIGNKGISTLDTNTTGVSATKLDKLGWRASDTAEIAFDNVEIQQRI
jgi:alkylation response protein AidB-like acyl-CoA dehydrogenase